MNKIKYTKHLIENLIKDTNSFKELISKLGITYSNGSIKYIKKIIKIYNININHFDKNVEVKIRKRYSNDEIFIISDLFGRSLIRARVIKDNLIPYICNVCGCNNQWQGKTMPLILDHINGINNDHRLENLRFLCSNCDSIQDTYKSKNQNQNNKQKSLRKKLEKENIKFLKKEYKEKNIKSLINQILSLNIDFKKWGWRLELSKYMNWTPQYAGNFLRKNLPEIWEICKKHNN